MKKISVLIFLALFSLLFSTCQIYDPNGNLMYDYKDYYRFEAPDTIPPVTAEEIENLVSVQPNGDVWILAARSDGTPWVTGGAIMDYFGINNWTRSPNGTSMTAIGTYAGKTVYGFKIPKDAVDFLKGEISDIEFVKNYGKGRGGFCFKFKMDENWGGQFAAPEGSPYHQKGSSGAYINCAIDFNNENVTPKYSPNR